MRREPRRSPVEPRSFEEGTIARIDASASAEQEALGELRRHVLGLVLVELVRFIEDRRWRSAVELTQLEGISYADAAELMVADLGYRPDPKTVWLWARNGVEQMTAWVQTTPWMAELMPSMPIEHPTTATDPVPLEDRLTGDRDGEPAEEEGHGTRGADLQEG